MQNNNIYSYYDKVTGNKYYLVAKAEYDDKIEYYKVYCVDTNNKFPNIEKDKKVLRFDDPNVIGLVKEINAEEIYAQYFND